MLRPFSLVWLFILLLGPVALLAQDDPVSVPDLTGLNVPQAAAELNRNGLRLGAELGTAWTADAPAPPNTVGGQSVAAGSAVAYGTEVDVTVLSTANVVLLYDDNDITLVNQTGAPLNMVGLAFNSSDGTKFFSATDWLSLLDAGDCGQLWSVTTRRDPKRLPECDATRWQGTNDTTKHFWTSLAGVTEFSVVQDGVQRVTCPAAPAGTDPLRCEFFVAGGVSAPLDTEYLHFAYTADRWVAVNTSTDRWMPIGSTPLLDPATGLLPSINSFFTDSTIVADVNRLAPGQCILLTTGDLSVPQPCDQVATAVVSGGGAFWQRGFQVASITDDAIEPVLCPPADATRLTLCIMTR
jgi:hypothetical protein